MSVVLKLKEEISNKLPYVGDITLLAGNANDVQTLVMKVR